jgi:hypothetical protein
MIVASSPGRGFSLHYRLRLNDRMQAISKAPPAPFLMLGNIFALGILSATFDQEALFPTGCAGSSGLSLSAICQT